MSFVCSFVFLLFSSFLLFVAIAEYPLRSINTSFAFDSVERETYRDDNFFFLLMIFSCCCCLIYRNFSVPVYTCEIREIFSMELISVVIIQRKFVEYRIFM